MNLFKHVRNFVKKSPPPAPLVVRRPSGLLLPPRETRPCGGWGRYVNGQIVFDPPPDALPEADEVTRALRLLPAHVAGWSSLSASMSTEYKITTAQINQTGIVTNPVSSSLDVRKSQSISSTTGNNASGGGDIAFCFQQGVGAGAVVNLDLTAMTDYLNRATQVIARIKAMQFRLLSATDDSTINPAPVATSTCVVTNNPPSSAAMDVPANIFPNGGSGLTLALTAAAGVITGVAIGAAGSGYPKSSSFLVAPQQAGGSGATVSVLTNASGVPTTVAVVYGGVGTGSGSTYTSATVPAVHCGTRFIYTGGAEMYFDPQSNGILSGIGSTNKKVSIVNLDGTNPITVEVDFIAGTS